MSEDAVSEEAVSEGLDWLKGETVLVAGGRISGLAAVVPLRELGAEVVVTDSDPDAIEAARSVGAAGVRQD